MAGQANNPNDRRRAEAGVGVQCVAEVGGPIIDVGTLFILWREPLRRAFAIQAYAEEIALRRLIGGGDVIKPAGSLVNTKHFGDVVGPAGDQPERPAVARHRVHVIPAVPLTDPEEALSTVEPGHLVTHVDPCAVTLGQDGP